MEAGAQAEEMAATVAETEETTAVVAKAPAEEMAATAAQGAWRQEPRQSRWQQQ